MNHLLKNPTVYTSGSRAFLTSVLTVIPAVLLMMFGLVLLPINLDEAELILFYFVVVPGSIAVSFVAIISIYRALYINKFPTKLLFTGWLMSFVLSFIMQGVVFYIIRLYPWTEYTMMWMILLITWITTVALSTSLFLLLVQKRQLRIK